MNKTKIEWCRNPDGTPGYTWNPITGCLNHIDGMCKGGGFPCYAYRLANTRLKDRYLANTHLPRGSEVIPRDLEFLPMDEDDPFYPRFWPERLKELQPIGGLVCELVYPPKTRRSIFVCDMGELFGDWIPYEWQEAVFRLIKKWPAHRFYLLTKQPQNLAKWSPFPDNCWVGVTATDYDSFYRGAINYLPKIQAKIKYISFEPLLQGMGKHIGGWLNACLIDAGISWVIIGSQTRPTVMPKIEWVREIIEACDQAGVPVFLKDNLDPSGTMKLRQEMPKEDKS